MVASRRRAESCRARGRARTSASRSGSSRGRSAWPAPASTTRRRDGEPSEQHGGVARRERRRDLAERHARALERHALPLGRPREIAARPIGQRSSSTQFGSAPRNTSIASAWNFTIASTASSPRRLAHDRPARPGRERARRAAMAPAVGAATSLKRSRGERSDDQCTARRRPKARRTFRRAPHMELTSSRVGVARRRRASSPPEVRRSRSRVVPCGRPHVRRRDRATPARVGNGRSPRGGSS